MDAAQYEYFQNELNRLIAARDEIRGRINGLNTVLAQIINHRESKKRLLETDKKVRDELNNKIREYETFKTNLESLSSSLLSVNGSIGSANSSLGSLIEGYSVRKENISGMLTTKKSKIWSNYLSVSSMKNSASGKITEMTKMRNLKNTEILNTDAIIRKLDQDIKNKQNEISSLKNNVEEIERSIRFYQEQL